MISKKFNVNKRVLLLLLIIVGVGAFIRLINLTILPVFVDEAIYVRWAQVMRAESTLRFLPLSDGKQPLFMWSVIPFFKLISNPLVAARTLSAIAGLGTIVGIFVAVYLLFNSEKKAVFASFIYAISPFSVFFERMALVDSMLTFFGVWIFIFGMLTAKTLRLDFAMISGFVLGGALLTKSPALFFVLLIPSTWILSKWPKRDKKKLLHLGKSLLLLAVTLTIGYGMYNVLRLGPNFHLLTSRNYDYVYPITHLFENPIDPFIPHVKDILDWFFRLGPWPLLIFGIAGVVLGYKEHRKKAFLILLWFLVPLFIQAMYAKVFTARYILFVVPFLAILSSIALEIKQKRLRLGIFIFFLLYVFVAGKQNYYILNKPEAANLPHGERSGYLEEWTAGTGIKENCRLFRKRSSKGL